MTPRGKSRLPTQTRSVCDEPQAFAYFRTHGRTENVQYASPALGARLAGMLVRLAAMELDVPACTLHVIDRGVVRPIARTIPDGSNDGPVPLASAHPLSSSLDAEIIRLGTPLPIANGYDGTAMPPMRNAVALLGVPVAGESGGVGGVLWIADAKPRHWSPGDIDRLRGLAREVAGVLPSDAGVREASRSWKSELLHAVTVESPIGLYALDERDGSVLIHNRCFLEIFSLDDLAARFDGCDITHDEVVARILQSTRQPRAIARALRRIVNTNGGGAIDTEFGLVNGHRVHCYSTQIRDESNGYLGRFFLVEDVTRRHRMEHDVADRTQMLHAIVSASPLAITVADRAGTISLWNPAAERLFGWRAAEVVGRGNPALEPALQATYQSIRDSTLRGDAVSDVELRLRSRDGRAIVVRASTAPLRYGQQSETKVMTVYADVTTHRDLEERLRQSQKMEAIGRFAGGVAHDFNNVLTIILTTAELALVDLPRQTALWSDLDAIRSAATHGAGLTRQLLSFARRSPVARERLDIAAVVDATVPMIKRLLPTRISLIVINQSAGAEAMADRGELQQVLLNLAANARDALVDGGAITIATRRYSVPADGRPEHVPDGDYIRLSVDDNGVGIPPEIRDRLFEPLFTTKDSGEGTGLGLATVYGIVLQAQGHIVVESQPRNTRFAVFLPALAPEHA